ncbi:winged helix DNA-binding domain-containing protein [Corynebacterium sp.]|uniref:winged helix DNA-binding domain-containing protein n=1 Tax=Corynebacterium sp. TaxID=1720 RepID=UPI003736FD4A
MKPRTKARARLLAQGLIGPGWSTPAEVVSAFGLMQGQEPTVFSSISLRSGGTIDDVRGALARGEIVRGYPMRGTVFAARADELRWLTELLAKPGAERARSSVLNAGGTDSDIAQIRDRVLAEGPVTNAEFKQIVAEVAPEASPRLTYRVRYLLMVESTLAYLGPDQRIGPTPDGGSLEEVFNGDRQAAATQIISRYIRAHGPVTFEDVRWWSKLPVAEIRVALAQLPDDIVRDDDYFYRSGLVEELAELSPSRVRQPHLLPAFDEYILGYQDRLFAMNRETHEQLVPGNMGVFRKPVVVDGIVRAAWRRVGGKLVTDEYTRIPAYAWPGVRRKFREDPFF